MTKKKKIDQEVKKKEPLRLYIDYSEHETGGEPLSDDEWCSYSDRHIQVSFHGISKTPPNRFFYHSHEVPEDVFNSDDVHLCVVRYSSGNTFGIVDGCWYVVGITKTSKEAQEMLERALNGDGYKPWEGYFESLQGTEIHSFKVKG